MTDSVVLWSEFLTTDPEVWVRFPALPDFLRNSGPKVYDKLYHPPGRNVID
jgi:hypothetical protein